MSERKPGPIEMAWRGYRARLSPQPRASAEQIEFANRFLRRAFYAGAAAHSDLVLQLSSTEDTTASDEALIAGMESDFEAFCEALGRGEA